MTGRDSSRDNRQNQENSNMQGNFSGFGHQALTNGGQVQVAPAAAVWDPSWPTHPVDPSVMPCAYFGYASAHIIKKMSRKSQSHGNSTNQRTANNKYNDSNSSSNNNNNNNNNNDNKETKKQNNKKQKNSDGHVTPPSISAYGSGEISVHEYEAKHTECVSHCPIIPVNPSQTSHLPSVCTSSPHPHSKQHTRATDTSNGILPDGGNKGMGNGNKDNRPTDTHPPSNVAKQQRNGIESVSDENEQQVEGTSGSSGKTASAEGAMHVDVDVDMGSVSMSNMTKFSLDSPPTPSSSSFSFTFQTPDAVFFGGSNPGFSS